MTITGSRGVNGSTTAAVRPAAPARPRTAAPERLPAPPRERRPAVVALGVLLTVGGALVAGFLALNLDARSPVVVAARDIAVGQQITREDLAETMVAADGLDLLPSERVDTVLGTYATSSIPAGRLLDRGMFSTATPLAPGQAAVGIIVPPGRAPASGLVAGDLVSVVRVDGGEGTVVTDDAVVSRAEAAGASYSGSIVGTPSGGGSGNTLATLVVAQADAPAVAAAAVDGSFSIVLLQRGR